MSLLIGSLSQAYAQAKARQALGHSCPGLHFPDVMAPWGYQEGANGVNEDAGPGGGGDDKFEILQSYWSRAMKQVM